jgi:DNA-binding XRE family transcriptional regulator
VNKLTLKQHRLIAGFSQEKMAEEMKVHRNTYVKIEENPDRATIKQAKKIGDILGASVDDLFFEE